MLAGQHVWRGQLAVIFALRRPQLLQLSFLMTLESTEAISAKPEEEPICAQVRAS